MDKGSRIRIDFLKEFHFGLRDILSNYLTKYVSHLNGQKQDFLNKELPSITRMKAGGCPDGSLEKKPPANAGDTGSNPGPGWSHMLPGN